MQLQRPMHQIKVANNVEGCDLFRIWLWALTDIEAQLFSLFVCDVEGTNESYNTQIGSIVVD